LAALIGSPKL
jgi:hypothetical protein